MICTKCQETGVYNEVMGQGFYFCRQCKTEIPLEVVAVDTSNKSFEELMQGLDPYDLSVFWANPKIMKSQGGTLISYPKSDQTPLLDAYYDTFRTRSMDGKDESQASLQRSLCPPDCSVCIRLKEINNEKS